MEMPEAHLVEAKYKGTMSQEIYTLWYGPYAKLSTARGEASKAMNGNWRYSKLSKAPTFEDSDGRWESTHFVEAFVISAQAWERE